MKNKNTARPDFFGKNAVIVCHDAMFGPPHELRDYLLEHRIKTLLFIGHENRALANNPVRSSYYELYKDGRRVKRFTSKIVKLPEALAYIKDTYMTLYWSLTVVKERMDIFVGVGNLNALAGLVLQSLGRAETVIYYVIDYIPSRFKNRLLNYIYHSIDAICALRCVTWNYSRSMIRARDNDWKKKFSNQLVIENGIHVRPQVIQPFSRVHITEIMYMGTLSRQQGIQLIIEALPTIRKIIPTIQFSLIGMGPFRKELERLAVRLKVQRQVKFLGYISDPIVMERRLAQSALGVAMYMPEGGFVQYTEPGKVKRYLSCGVPVVMTDVSPLASQIEKKRCGFQCPYATGRLASTVISFLTDTAKMRDYRKNAVAFVSQYTWERIFTKAFATSTK